MVGYISYNNAVKYRRHGEITIYDFDTDLYHNGPEWTRSYNKRNNNEVGTARRKVK